MTLTRRQLLKRGAAGGAALTVPGALLRSGVAAAAPPTANLASFVTPFEKPSVLTLGPTLKGQPSTAFTAQEITRKLHRDLALTPSHPWSYADDTNYNGYLGPTIQVWSGDQLTVDYSNGLPQTYPFPRIPVDRNLTANDVNTTILTHLHGGFVSGSNDGNPAASNGVAKNGTQQAVYPNNQRATLLWYHDHALGATRLNVFAGLAGGYLIRDANDTGGPKAATDPNPWLPVGKYELPLVIQDRQFVAKGAAAPLVPGDFLYPTMPPGMGTIGECGKPPNYYPLPEWNFTTGPWLGEYFGDEMLVNGICTPVLEVEPAVYRFRILNGCNARFLDLVFQNAVTSTVVPPSWTVIGNDQGLVATAAVVKELTLVNAERTDVLVDFRNFAGQDFLLRNSNLPKPYVSPAPRLQDVMKFQVRGTRVDPPVVFTPGTTTIDGGQDGGQGLGNATVIRRIALDEWNAGLPGWFLTLSPIDAVAPNAYPAGPLPPLVPQPANTPAAPGQAACFHDTKADIVAKGLTPEEPRENAVEEWEFHNRSADTHPMHMHLTKFQVVDRRPLGTAPGAAGTVPPLPFEKGWKDTVAAHPGMITRIRQQFELPTGASVPQQYVYHCHIVEHEDNDMMRPFTVVAA